MFINEGRETKLSFHIRSELNATFQNGTLPLSQNVSTGEQIARNFKLLLNKEEFVCQRTSPCFHIWVNLSFNLEE